MKLSIKAGATSVSINVFVQDSSSTTGAGLTGLVFNTSSLTAYYALPAAAAVSITLATLAAVTSSYSSGGFKEIDATNMPGWYRFDVPNAALASGRFVSLHFKGATNMAPLPVEIELTATDNQSATAFITGVNSLAPPSNWNSMVIDGSGRVDVSKIAGTSQTARDIGASVLISSGTGSGQLDVSSGAIKIQTGSKKNQALAKFEFVMTDSTTHAPATGKTVSITRSVDGGAFGAGTLGAVTELSNGVYYTDIPAADLNGNVVTLRATASGADDLFVTFTLEP